jgi:hypothetical protein
MACFGEDVSVEWDADKGSRHGLRMDVDDSEWKGALVCPMQPYEDIGLEPMDID